MWRIRGAGLDLSKRPLVMGIVNVTPDSFSDGGKHASPEAAVALARRLVAEGADVLDIGGESTRPGAEPVSADEELRRILPVVQGASRLGPISVDTYKADVAAKAIDAGASIVNDVTGLRDPAMRRVCAERGVGVVIMHMKGEPRTMQEAPSYADVVAEVAAFLRTRADDAMRAGIARDAIVLDPGLGFGKSPEHNLALIRGLRSIAECGPVLVGVSRKSFLGALTGAAVHDRLAAGLAATAVAVQNGARVIRTHDVKETLQTVTVAQALTEE